MVTSNKTSTRSPGRTPPFILIGLLLLLGFLGYSYWSLNNANAVLSVELEAVRIQKKDTDQINFESEKNIAYTKKGLIEAQDNLNNARKQLRSKDSELTSVKSDLHTKQTEAEKLRIEKNECDINFSDLKTKLEGLQGENDKLKQQLEEEKAKPVVCDVVSCKSSVKEILGIVAKVFGSTAVKKALSEANSDASTFMEGIDFPAPVVPQQQDPKLQEKVRNPLDKDPNPQQQAPNPQQQAPNPQQQAPNPQEQTPNQQQQAPKQQTLSEVSLQQAANKNEQDKGSQVENNTDEKNNDENNSEKEKNVHDNSKNILQSDANKKAKETLLFESDRNRNVAEISEHLASFNPKKDNNKQEEDEADEEANAEDLVTKELTNELAEGKEIEADNDETGDKADDGYDDQKDNMKEDNIQTKE